MNKTIIININGFVFHIEEDAYEVLKAYMTEVKRHFAYSPDSAEIVGDIENRIAEMFNERLTAEKKQVIVIKDVELVTEQMGAVSQFTETEDTEFTAEQLTERKLFRDTDDKIIGGVCSGIAHYFNIEARIVRIIALLLLLPGGSGFLIYIILFIVMPPARTRAEKMAMKGEPMNLQSIKRNFEDEAELHTRFAGKSTDVISNFFRNVFELIGNTFGSIFRLFIKIIGGLIILAGSMALIGTIVALFVTLGFWSSSELDMFPFNIINPEYETALYFSVFVLIAIPIIALIFFAIRVLFNRRTITKTAAFVMLVVWLTGLAVGVYHGAKLGAEFSEEATYEQSTPLGAAAAYRLELNEDLLFDKQDSLEYNLADSGSTRVVMNRRHDEGNMPRSVSLAIETGDVTKPTLIVQYSARGNNFKNALQGAKKVSYHFAQADSVLRFDWSVQLPKGEAWRDQSVRLKLLLPPNTRLHIDGKLNPYLEDYNLNDCLPESAPSEAMSTWVLTPSGLKCQDEALYKQNTEDE
ncbi:MAG: PspC domain protein [Sphingobacteriaceae bacterium]|jgi:phage shock protein PspC (stress-responsive transcriptional regulator)|nr:PspC domain protein [Sphingobacteriaceae bacterium]